MLFDKQEIKGDLPVNKSNVLFFSCDPKYWAEHGQYLAKSTLSLKTSRTPTRSTVKIFMTNSHWQKTIQCSVEVQKFVTQRLMLD